MVQTQQSVLLGMALGKCWLEDMRSPPWPTELFRCGERSVAHATLEASMEHPRRKREEAQQLMLASATQTFLEEVEPIGGCS